MTVEKIIKKRRSIRQYRKEVPTDDQVNKILRAGTWAPSGLNNQPWKFKLVKGKDREGLAKFTTYRDIIRAAPVAICVFLDNGATYNREKDIMAIGACIQNMLLEACELGLGACWLGEILNKREEVEKYLGVGSAFELMAVVTLGYANEEAQGERKSLKSFILK